MKTLTKFEQSDAFARVKRNAENKAIEMAKIQLSVWNKKFESELIKYEGYTKDELKKMKKNFNKQSKQTPKI